MWHIPAITGRSISRNGIDVNGCKEDKLRRWDTIKKAVNMPEKYLWTIFGETDVTEWRLNSSTALKVAVSSDQNAKIKSFFPEVEWPVARGDVVSDPFEV